MKATAELILQNANIRTLNDAMPRAASMAAGDGRVFALSETNDDFASLQGPGTRILDLGGNTVLPGFVDTHEHLSFFSEEPLHLDFSPRAVSTIEEIRTAVAEKAKSLPPGEWIRGIGYDDTKTADDRPLHRDDLDAAAPDHPVIAIHISHHWAVVNSRALSLGGLTPDSPDPDGGVLGRDASGRLDGRLFEMAMYDFAYESLARVPTVVPPFPREARKQAVLDAARFLNRLGITGVGDALVSPSYITTYHDLAATDDLPLRVNMMVPFNFLEYFEKLGLIGGWGNRRLKCGGIKIIVDGAISARTAALRDGYLHDPDDHGVLLIENPDTLTGIVSRIHDMGYQAYIHANGDIALEMALTAIETAMEKNPRPDPRHRLEHCTMIDDSILARMKKSGVVATPFASYVYQHGEKLERFYGKRVNRMFAHKSFLDAGVAVAGASDHPAGLASPLLGIRTMVTRKTPAGDVLGGNERISVEEAVKMYTTYAAYATFDETDRGTLVPGKAADFVVLGADPWTAAPEEIHEIDVLATAVGGVVVYEI
jgi:hypothetical protein